MRIQGTRLKGLIKTFLEYLLSFYLFCNCVPLLINAPFFQQQKEKVSFNCHQTAIPASKAEVPDCAKTKEE